LGHQVDLLTRIGDDARGAAVRAHLEGSGVHLAAGSVTTGRTSTATARIDASGAASYEFRIDWRLDALPSLDGYRALHTGSIAAFLEPGGSDVVALAKAASRTLTVTYDPNARPALMGDAVAARSRVEEIVAHAHVVKVSDEDLAWLAPGEDPHAVARAWQRGGPALVIVTHGGDGAHAVFASDELTVPGARVDVVDTVGAGDSFMGALLDHLARHDLLGPESLPRLRALGEDDVRVMIEHAVRVAGITCSRAGANPPTHAELALV
jgi:fructokinase